MATLRSPETKIKYKEWINAKAPSDACPLCEREPLETFKFWKLIDNKFPYDRVAKTHHTLVTLRHVPETELSDEEKDELIEIKRGYANERYDYVLEATPKALSIPEHFHVHFMVIKDFEI
jgi:hypothetical protein